MIFSSLKNFTRIVWCCQNDPKVEFLTLDCANCPANLQKDLRRDTGANCPRSRKQGPWVPCELRTTSESRGMLWGRLVLVLLVEQAVRWVPFPCSPELGLVSRYCLEALISVRFSHAFLGTCWVCTATDIYDDENTRS